MMEVVVHPGIVPSSRVSSRSTPSSSSSSPWCGTSSRRHERTRKRAILLVSRIMNLHRLHRLVLQVDLRGSDLRVNVLDLSIHALLRFFQKDVDLSIDFSRPLESSLDQFFNLVVGDFYLHHLSSSTSSREPEDLLRLEGRSVGRATSELPSATWSLGTLAIASATSSTSSKVGGTSTRSWLVTIVVLLWGWLVALLRGRGRLIALLGGRGGLITLLWGRLRSIAGSWGIVATWFVICWGSISRRRLLRTVVHLRWGRRSIAPIELRERLSLYHSSKKQWEEENLGRRKKYEGHKNAGSIV